MRFLDRYYHLVIFVFLSISTFCSAQEVTLATGINTDPPFVYGDYDISANNPGITIDILKLIEKKTNIKFIIKKRPWARVVKEVKENVLDGGFHFSFKKERRSFVSYPIIEGEDLPDVNYSISNRSYALYRLKGNTIRWNGENILHDSNHPAEIAVIRGGSITETIKNLGHSLLEVNSDRQMLMLLLLNRVDALIGLENMIDEKIRTLAHDQQILIEKTYPEIINKPYYLAFSKKFYHDHPHTAWKIWDTIRLIKSSGELAEIERRYSDR